MRGKSHAIIIARVARAMKLVTSREFITCPRDIASSSRLGLASSVLDASSCSSCSAILVFYESPTAAIAAKFNISLAEDPIGIICTECSRPVSIGPINTPPASSCNNPVAMDAV